jgi:tRNA pseudouridine38-40 synthase
VKPLRAFKMTLAYDGTDFVGWQRQPKRRTVQAELEKAILEITRTKVHCVASGRTDAGVHALGQVASFESPTLISGPALCKGLNALLPDDIVVFEVVEARPRFHAIRDAVRKRYRYVIQDGPHRDLFARKYLWHIRKTLDVEAMQQAALGLVGTHDFESYQSSGSSRLTTIRTVYDVMVERRRAELTDRVIIEVESNGFLYNMVRNIAGTLVEVGKGRQSIDWPARVLTEKDRRAAGMTAPPEGLFLIGVEYDGNDFGLRIADTNQEDPISAAIAEDEAAPLE